MSYGKVGSALKMTKGKKPPASGTKIAVALANTKKDSIDK